MTPEEEAGSNLWRELWAHDPMRWWSSTRSPHLHRQPFLLLDVHGEPCPGSRHGHQHSAGRRGRLSSVFATGQAVEAQTRRFPTYGRTLREVCFPVKEHHVVAAIFHDITREERQAEELQKMREESGQR